MAPEEEAPPAVPARERALRVLSRSWEWLVVALLSFWMLLVRLRPYGHYNFDDQVHFIGTDPYYHARQVLFTVDNFPSTLGYDAMTQYPLGTSSGQFGTLFDQGAAALAWIWGLVVDGGHPTEQTVMDVYTAYPAILGALTLVPAYLVARHLAGRGPALVTALALALIPGEFMIRSLAAYVDHHVMEILWSTFAVWGVLITLRAWEQSELTLRGLVDAPRTLLGTRARRPLLLSLVAILFFWAYIASWPPGVLFIGIVGVWLVLDVIFEQLRGRDPSPVVLTTLSVFLPLAFVLFAIQDHAYGFSALQHTWLQPTAALILTVAAAVLGALSLVWHRKEYPRAAYPAVVVGLGLVGGGLLRLTIPMLYSNLQNGFGWLTGLGVARTRTTIAEAQTIIQRDEGPALAQINADMTGEFGLLFYTAFFAMFFVAWRAYKGHRRGDTLLLVWAIFATTASFSQVRFFYYLAIIVALLNGELYAMLTALFRRLTSTSATARGTSKGGGRRRRHAEEKRLGWGAPTFAALIVLVAIMPVNVFSADRNPNAWDLAGFFRPDEEARWAGPLIWLRDNSPPIPVGLDDDLDRPPARQPYDYPQGMYGVLAWWDYGHQIELLAERPPVANPFQQQAPLASRILTAETEDAALALLDEYLGEGNQVRYVMVDDETVSSKFGAIAIWAERYDEYRQLVNRKFAVPPDADDALGGEEIELPVWNPVHKSWFVQRLYNDDARTYEHFRLVYESATYAYIGYRVRLLDDGRIDPIAYNSPLGHNSARELRDSFGDLNFDSGRFIVQGAPDRLDYAAHLESAVKIYERVPGARLTGRTDPGAEVTAEITLQTTNTEREFTYRQTATAGADGSFEITVPYATGEPTPTEQGGTNYALRASAPYTVTAGNESVLVSVPDAAVLEGRTIAAALG